MKVFLVIVAMFVAGITDSAYAAGDQQDQGETTEGIIDAIKDFFESLFGDSGNSGDTSGDTAGTHSAGENSANGSEGSPNSGGGNSIPVMQDNDSSAEFIAAQIAADTGWAKDEMIPYSKRLAKTLSQLSAKEQAEVFYGSR